MTWIWVQLWNFDIFGPLLQSWKFSWISRILFIVKLKDYPEKVWLAKRNDLSSIHVNILHKIELLFAQPKNNRKDFSTDYRQDWIAQLPHDLFVRLQSEKSWFTGSRPVWIALFSRVKHFSLRVPLSIQGYKWVPANLMPRWVALRPNSIPSRGKKKHSFHTTETGKSTAMMVHLARIQALLICHRQVFFNLLKLLALLCSFWSCDLNSWSPVPTYNLGQNKWNIWTTPPTVS